MNNLQLKLPGGTAVPVHVSHAIVGGTWACETTCTVTFGFGSWGVPPRYLTITASSIGGLGPALQSLVRNIQLAVEANKLAWKERITGEPDDLVPTETGDNKWPIP